MTYTIWFPVESRARQLHETCVERARNVKELLQQYNKERGKAQVTSLSPDICVS